MLISRVKKVCIQDPRDLPCACGQGGKTPGLGLPLLWEKTGAAKRNNTASVKAKTPDDMHLDFIDTIDLRMQKLLFVATTKKLTVPIRPVKIGRAPIPRFWGTARDQPVMA